MSDLARKGQQVKLVGGAIIAILFWLVVLGAIALIVWALI